jgi:hypothetical protein
MHVAATLPGRPPLAQLAPPASTHTSAEEPGRWNAVTDPCDDVRVAAGKAANGLRSARSHRPVEPPLGSDDRERTLMDPNMRATYVLLHGAGDVAWYWHHVAPMLRDRGHDVVAMDLPVDDDRAGLLDYADTVIEAVGDRSDLILVAQSFSGYVAPLVCERLSVNLIVLVAAMVPAPGESATDMFAHTRYPGPAEKDEVALFYHDVDPSLAAHALERGRTQSTTPSNEPWPLQAWPAVPTRFLLCQHDRLFPAAWLRGVVRDRLGIVPDEIESAHTPALSHPVELVEWLERYRADVLKVST